MANLAADLQLWMTKLPDQLRSIPVIHLAIPGSHDSTTFGISSKSNISPDARNPIQYLKFLEPVLRPLMIKWSKTQCLGIGEQLNAGIRYFDLRIARKSEVNKFYFVHNLYSECVNSVLEHINHFLNEHSNEIVILDCQHFYKLTANDHKQFVYLLKTIFKSKLLPYSHSMTHISLNYMTKENSYQVILIYRAEIVHDLSWPGASFPTPWPDTVDVRQVINFLDRGLKNRNHSLGFVSQCVLTPTIWFVCKHIFSSLRDKCVLPLEKPKYDWLKKQSAGNKGLNIVISDFIEYQDYQFSKEVINLNSSILNKL